MAPKSHVPIRICGSKTRSGCRTCKQRHVKCDERQPVCLRCEKAGRLCIYNPPQSLIQQQAATLDKKDQPAALVAWQHCSYLESSNLAAGVSLYGSYDVAEVCAVKHFAAFLGRDLAGCFSDDVWCHIVPQVAQREPSIWHATAAISMLNSETRVNHGSGFNSSTVTMAVLNYSKAIRELSLRLETVNDACGRDVVLLSCVLFAVFECMQSHYQSALQHIAGGLKLLTDWGYEANYSSQDTAGGYLDYRFLQPIFLALESQAVQMGIIPCRDLRLLPVIKGQQKIPACFTSIQEAHLVLNHIFNGLSHWMVGIDPDTDYCNKPKDMQTMVEGQRLQTQLAHWDTALNPLLESLGNQPSTLLLLIQRKVIQTLVNRSVDGFGEAAWDMSLPLFQEAIEYAEIYMHVTIGSKPSHMTNGECPKKSGPVLTVAMDIVMSLFLISTKCRDMEIRRRALTLLKICNRKEGIWDSNECAFLAEKMIELEEASAEQDGYIPVRARIHELDVHLSEDNTASVKIKKLHLAKDGRYSLKTAEQTLL